MLQVKIYGFYTFIFFICSHIFGIGGRGLYCYHFSCMSSLGNKTHFLFIKKIDFYDYQSGLTYTKHTKRLE